MSKTHIGRRPVQGFIKDRLRILDVWLEPRRPSRISPPTHDPLDAVSSLLVLFFADTEKRLLTNRSHRRAAKNVHAA